MWGERFWKNLRNFEVFLKYFEDPQISTSRRNAPEHRNKTCFGGLCKVLQKNRQYLKHVSNWSPGCWRLFRAVKHDQIVFCRHPKVSRTPLLRGKCPFSRCWKSRYQTHLGHENHLHKHANQCKTASKCFIRLPEHVTTVLRLRIVRMNFLLPLWHGGPSWLKVPNPEIFDVHGPQKWCQKPVWACLGTQNASRMCRECFWAV